MLGSANGWLQIIGTVGWATIVLRAAVGAETTSTRGKVTALMSAIIYMTDVNASASIRFTFLLQIRDLWIHSGSRQCFLMTIKDRVGFWGNGIKELFVADHIQVLIGGGQRILIRCQGRSLA